MFDQWPHEEFIVAVDDPVLLGGTLGRRIPRARTVYEISYSILPTGDSLP